MISFAIILIILAIVAVILITVLGVGGAGILIVFGDLIICAYIIKKIIDHFRRKR